jgi:3-isopropylmalate/(R)-2-methylmalate dehydratase large subunit
MNKTLFDKIWDSHTVQKLQDNNIVLYIDRHYIHEVTSPQAFQKLKNRNIKIFRPNQITATTDHNVPTQNQHLPIKDRLSKEQIKQLEYNCKINNIQLYNLNSDYQGIVHVIGPELGFTLPGNTIVCGDSHTSTHGAFGSIAFGIGTSQVAMVLATQCIIETKPKQMRININGVINLGVTAKDIIMYIISKLGSNAGTGYFIEFKGDVISKMTMEQRMTICNMSIEMGAKGSIIQPDKTTFEYLYKTKFSRINQHIINKYWNKLQSDQNVKFDIEYFFNAKHIYPMITYGTNPDMAITITGNIPLENQIQDKKLFNKALKYMGFSPGEALIGKKIQHVFIGSCTNSRIEDLRLAAKIIQGEKKHKNIKAMIVPGSRNIARLAVQEGLDKIFKDAEFDFREPGCSACLGMNEDKIPKGQYCLSTSNRNFEGRQGVGARTILSSPIIASIAAIEGKISNITNYVQKLNK